MLFLCVRVVQKHYEKDNLLAPISETFNILEFASRPRIGRINWQRVQNLPRIIKSEKMNSFLFHQKYQALTSLTSHMFLRTCPKT
ncbi:hypothetical protein KHM19_04520 [Leptospira borgpetersenii]|uniref:Uncharacterized protein n=1 Tax=Leptospira borgpetersenii serovar Javanica str. UI 09931 TaxID=1049767 RepID=A0AAV3JC90_LEPBO|nr:hypothetical protein C4Q31_02395 [Leptospira borgpetersenii serovar Ceylonica]EKQ92123.1 hypothetical protein LEP1GSC101_3349 [Leptospira borgpetersenii str. UI 09149]EPG57567.1 hypothetical protein LEP1GSC103_3011 [Leptospira borgpetersenii serovar Javanica str. UI 09931]GIM18066.1 hypothetical protein KHM09_05170 [Leptospira borgpetersenii]GIM21269.1 hypothetical protein KHM19_04520 [Leptospira borgpetersenii]